MVRQRRKKPRKKKVYDSITTMTVYHPNSKQPRNWNAVNAQFRNSAGPMHDRRKEDKKDWREEYADDETRDGGSDLCTEDV